MIPPATSVHQRLFAARSGSLPLEFALIGSALTAMLLVCIQLGFLLYAQIALDFAAKEAGRQLLTGRIFPVPPDKEGFQSVAFCPYLSRFIACKGVVIHLRPVADFLGGMSPDPGSSDYETGEHGSLMLLQAYYTVPITKWPLNIHTLVGTAAFRIQ